MDHDSARPRSSVHCAGSDIVSWLRLAAILLAQRADVAQLVAHHLAKVRVAGSNPVVRSRGQPASVVEWPRGEATACKAVYTGSNPVSTSRSQLRSGGRLAQWESTTLTR